MTPDLESLIKELREARELAHDYRWSGDEQERIEQEFSELAANKIETLLKIIEVQAKALNLIKNNGSAYTKPIAKEARIKCEKLARGEGEV